MTSGLRRAAAGTALALLLACARVPSTPHAGTLRLAAMAPAAAEMAALLGRSDAVVAVGDHVRYPAELAGRPRIGAFDAPNAERLLELGVTHMLTTESAAAAMAHARLRALGITVVELDTATVNGTLAALGTVGALLDRAAVAEGEVAAIRARLAAVRARVAGAPRRSTLLVVGREPLWAAGPGSYLDELLQTAGGENILADLPSAFAMASREVIVARQPELIIELAARQAQAALDSWRDLTSLPAVRLGRVVLVDPLRFGVPGPRLAEMAESLARIVHPELCGPATAADLGPLVAAER